MGLTLSLKVTASFIFISQDTQNKLKTKNKKELKVEIKEKINRKKNNQKLKEEKM